LRSVCAAALALAAATLPAAGQREGLASFDTTWAVIEHTHFDSTFNGVDWAAAREELRPRAEAARLPPKGGR
jgi:carboxyl-terminal processing protease